MDTQENYRRAVRRVREKKKFYRHATTYVIMSGFFFMLNMVTSPGEWWFFWPMLGWGIGIANHYFKVFGWPGSGVGSTAWEDAEVEKEMRRIEQHQRPFVNMDDHLELRELEREKLKDESYDQEDLV